MKSFGTSSRIIVHKTISAFYCSNNYNHVTILNLNFVSQTGKMRLFLVAAISVLVLLYCTRETCGQTFSTIIFPEGKDGANPLISAVENTENVTFFCEVTRISDGVQRQTLWTLIKNGVETSIPFTSEGLGQTGFENYVVSQETLRSNFTILVFNETFDNNQIGCGSGGQTVSRFDLRIISE